MPWLPWCQPDAPLIIYVFWFILCSVSLFNLLFAIFAIRKTIQSSAPSDKLLIVIMLCFMTPGFQFAYHIAQSLLCTSDYWNWMLPGIIGGFLYLLGLALIYYFYLYRLRKIFSSTPYAISLWLYALFILLFIAQLCALFALTMLPFALTMTREVFGLVLNCYNIFVITNFVGNVSILTMFVRKIYVLGCVFVTNGSISDPNDDGKTVDVFAHYPYDNPLNQDEILTITASSTASASKSTQSRRERKQIQLKLKKLLNPTIRYVVCAFVAMISSNILSILGLYRSNPISNDHGILSTLHILGVTIDQSLNMFCLYLQYSFSDERYDHCCSPAHQCIFNSFVKRIFQNKTDDNTESEALSHAVDGSDAEIEGNGNTLYDHITNSTKISDQETTTLTTGVSSSPAIVIPPSLAKDVTAFGISNSNTF